jgi:thioredoxin reductase
MRPTPSRTSYLVERVEAADNVEVVYHTEIRRMLGDAVLEAVEIETDANASICTAAYVGNPVLS